MSGESLIRVVQDVRLEDPCSTSWSMAGGQTAAYAAPQQGSKAGWGFFCTKHGQNFGVHESCPSSLFIVKKGETLSVPSKLARQLVEHDLAVYPTHETAPDEGITETLGRVNALMDEQGLPHMDAASLGAIAVEGRREHYQRPAKPRDARLANNLGLDAADIEAMRRAARGI